MPTNEERREVARRLRYVAEHGAPEWATTACCIAECIGEDDYPLWNGSGLLFSKLANLIEPEERTCHVEHIDDDLFHMSCGHEAAGCVSPSFCPYCGGRVEEGE